MCNWKFWKQNSGKDSRYWTHPGSYPGKARKTSFPFEILNERGPCCTPLDENIVFFAVLETQKLE